MDKMKFLAWVAYIFVCVALIVFTICLLVVGAEIVRGVYEYVRDEIERRRL